MSEIVLAFAIGYYKVYGDHFFNNVHVLIDFRNLLKATDQDDVIYRPKGCFQSEYMTHLKTLVPIVIDKYDVGNHSEFSLNGFARTITEHAGDVSFERTFTKLIKFREETYVRDSLMLMIGLSYIYPSVKSVQFLLKYACDKLKVETGGLEDVVCRHSLNAAYKDIKHILLRDMPDDK